MNIGKTFETTYPNYPFSELVRLSIALGSALRARRALRSSPGRWAQPTAVMSQGPSPTAEAYHEHRGRRLYPQSN